MILQTLTLEIIDRCFQKCVYCSSGSIPDTDLRLSLDKIKSLLLEFKNLGGVTVEFSGGEPIAHPDLLEMVEYAKSIGLKTDLFTSGHYENGFNFDVLPFLDRVFLNIQGPTEEIHDYLTGITGSFSQVIRLGKELVERKIWVGTHIIPFSYNLEEIGDYVNLAKFLGFQNVSLLRFVEQGRGRDMDVHLKLNTNEILTLHEIIYNNRLIEEIEFKYGCPLDFQFLYNDNYQPIPCSSGISRCVIKVDGKVLPCPAFKDLKEFVAGNIHKSSLFEIWNHSPIFKVFRELDYTNITGQCSECRYLSICRGRCPAQRYHSHNEIMQGPDVYCPIYLEEGLPHN